MSLGQPHMTFSVSTHTYIPSHTYIHMSMYGERDSRMMNNISDNMEIMTQSVNCKSTMDVSCCLALRSNVS